MEFGWLSAVAKTNTPIVGTHSHVLDVAGHVYSSRADKLEQYYQKVDDMIKNIIDNSDELVILSDHGMKVEILNDPNPGKHSERAFISSTLDSELPQRVKDVEGWLYNQISKESSDAGMEELDAPEDHLKALGYF